MTTEIKAAEQRFDKAIEVEGYVHDQLVAIDILTANIDGYFDPDIERMTMRQAAKIVAKIEHPSMDNANVDLRAVYEDLDLRYEEAIKESDNAKQALVELVDNDK